MVGTRDTPPSVQDGDLGIDTDGLSDFEAKEGAEQGATLSPQIARKIASDAYSSSTSWVNAGRRQQWNDSLRAFNSQHPQGSKYLSGDYRYRSTMFRPKTRSMVRRDEAATAAAFFANEDVVSITAADDDDPKQQASAEILKALMQYRLANADNDDRIPWFMTLIGARQDADVMGICVSKTGWEYEERYIGTQMRPTLGSDGMPAWDIARGQPMMEPVDLYEKVKDRPFIDLLAPENFRFEPGCDWRNPVKSSPYLIELSPVYVQEALERMESQRGAPPEWNAVPIGALRGSNSTEDDATRRTREAGRVPGKDDSVSKPKDFDICWTRIMTLRWGGRDWYYRTLAGSGELLEPPRPLEEVYLHGERPYVVGCVVLETHKTYPSSKVDLTRELQRAVNQDVNSRFDAVMLGLQPRQFVREGLGIDLNDLRTFMPGRAVSLAVPKDMPMQNAITWDRAPPIDGAAFQEQDRLNLDWDDLAGSFTNTSVGASQATQQSATGMHLMSGEASGLNEYELRLFSESFVEPTLRLLIKAIQAYETDAVILALAGKKANLLQRFGIDQITDELLNQNVTTKVNVGIGATNPQLKLRNFATGADIIAKIFGPAAAMGANFQEICKEVFGMLGFKDGARFFQPGFDPRVQMLQQQLQKSQHGQHGQGGQGAPPDPMRLQVAQIQAQGKIQERTIQGQTDLQVAQLDLQRQALTEQAETQRQIASAHKDLLIAQHQSANQVHPALRGAGL